MCANAVAFRPLEALDLRGPEGRRRGSPPRVAMKEMRCALGHCGKDGTRARCFVSDIRLSPIPPPVA
jgi:hypothetical protein